MGRENWWDEETERLNRMSEIANQMGVVVDVKAKVPKLAPNGALAAPYKKPPVVPGETHTTNYSNIPNVGDPWPFERDLEVIANEFGLDKETLRDEYTRRTAPGGPDNPGS